MPTHPIDAMNAIHPASERQRYTLDDLQRLHDRAHERARRLRSQTLDQAWRAVAAGIDAQRLRARRAASRLALSLARHWRGRARPAAPCEAGG